MASVGASALRSGLSRRIGAILSSNLRTRVATSYCDKRNVSLTSQCFGVTPIQLTMPALSPTMTEGTIVSWLKSEGDPIAAGDGICEIETDKATVIMDADDDGIMAKILVLEGSKNIPITSLIALMVPEGEDYKDVDIPAQTAPASTPAGDSPKQSEEGVSESAEFTSMRHAVTKSGEGLSPAVRALIEQHQIDPSLITPTGPHGRLLKGDVLKFIESGGAAAAPQPAAVPPPSPAMPAVQPPPVAERVAPPSYTRTEGMFSEVELTGMRKTIAKRLTESKTTIPHSYSMVDCELTEIVRLRKQLKKDNIKVSVNDFIIKAAAVALKQVPEVNVSWNGQQATPLTSIDISVAVATDGGLITPIVKSADAKGLVEISANVKDLATRARANKLKLDEFQGGSFSISNLGMFGISEFSAVINPPQSCIMAIGTSKLAIGKDRKPFTYMTVTMSSDARVVDGALAARFLEKFKQNIESPIRLGLL
ncbi:pyruvate dehydrogenase protein X component-like [Lytechinus variegatus]|uniref:pyruvate dehydrogenase protein X component-like n=1 Tax=Lytechinus variegatus TaxID=7654 RepID=UPI001BB19531|nr:pyruvate dehydrogenase protein X component-like [Lytechinus variegatus]